jgi:hypothetical protein
MKVCPGDVCSFVNRIPTCVHCHDRVNHVSASQYCSCITYLPGYMSKWYMPLLYQLRWIAMSIAELS